MAQSQICFPRKSGTRMRTILLGTLSLLFCVSSAKAQETAPGKLACPNEIPAGVKIVRLPVADQSKLTISDFALSTAKDDASYDLAMRIKNGTDNWCITSFAFVFSFGDARGQEWVANEYPAVKRFTTKPQSLVPPKGQKSPPSPPIHSVGLNPGQDETRVLFDVYDYIQPRPTGTFDGFHVISGQIKSSMGYILTTTK